MDELEKVERKLNMIEEEQTSFARSFLEDYKSTNRRMFFIILVLIAYCGFITYKYITTENGYEIITETTETDGEGNACVGDNCINGDMNG